MSNEPTNIHKGDSIMGGLLGDGGKKSDISAIPSPSKPRPTRIEPDLERARKKKDIRSRQISSLATRAPLGEARTKSAVLGIEPK